MFEVYNSLINGKQPIFKKCTDENNEEYEGAFCPYCGEQIYYVECYLKTPIKNEEYDPDDICSSQTIAFNKILNCIQLSEENYNGCGAKFSLDNEEIGYYEYTSKGYATTSCSSILEGE